MSHKILIALDNADNVTAMQACLAWSLGIPDSHVIGCYNSADALDYLKRNPVHLLITKYELQALDGLSLIEDARMINPDIVTCLISASIDLDQDEGVQTMAPHGLLHQPFEPKQLIEIVGQLTRLIEPT